MGILIVRKPATPSEIEEMRAELELESPELQQRFESIARSLLEIE